MRNPLDKDKFLGGNRQKWTAIFLTYSIIFAILHIKYQLDVSPFMNFALTIGSLFMVGSSVDSYQKINAAKTFEPNTNKTNENHYEPPNC